MNSETGTKNTVGARLQRARHRAQMPMKLSIVITVAMMVLVGIQLLAHKDDNPIRELGEMYDRLGAMQSKGGAGYARYSVTCIPVDTTRMQRKTMTIELLAGPHASRMKSAELETVRSGAEMATVVHASRVIYLLDCDTSSTRDLPLSVVTKLRSVFLDHARVKEVIDSDDGRRTVRLEPDTAYRIAAKFRHVTFVYDRAALRPLRVDFAYRSGPLAMTTMTFDSLNTSVDPSGLPRGPFDGLLDASGRPVERLRGYQVVDARGR